MSALKLVFVAAVLGVGCVPASVTAQVTQSEQPSHVCMKAGRTGQSSASHVAMVAPEKKESIKTIGYSEVPCPTGRMSFEQYRSQICKLAGEAPEPVARQFQRDYRLNFEQLCELAGGL